MTLSSTTITNAQDSQHSIPNLTSFGDHANEITGVAPRSTEDDRPLKKFCAARFPAADSVTCPEDFEVPEKNTFFPVLLKSLWEEYGTTTMCLSLAILLPPGVGPNEVNARVMEGGRHLEIAITWPLPLCDFSVLLKLALIARGRPH